MGKVLFGRKRIFTDAAYIGPDNIMDELVKAMEVHARNQEEIEYLYNYRKGDQPILNRTKEVRPEICNKVVENRADEIVEFKTGYLIGEPVQYVSRREDPGVCDAVTQLNDFMLSEDKDTSDTELVDWMYTCGLGYRLILPDSQYGEDEDEAPFEITTLDPRQTFVVHRNTHRKEPLFAATFVDRKNTEGRSVRVFSVYTDNLYMEVENPDSNGSVTVVEPQILGIPIVEYDLNLTLMGGFETVLSLLDAINITESNRIDGIEQFIQALLLFHNVDISTEDFKELKEMGAVKFKDLDSTLKGEIEYLTAQLNQGDTQTVVDHMYNTVLTLVGMPNRNGGSSTSDTGTAVIYRDGHAAAEGRAKKDEKFFSRSEREFLKVALKITRILGAVDLKLSDIKIQYTRRNYEHITEKANVLVTMLGCNKIHPLLAYQACGMFSDPNIAYKESMDYAEEQEKKQAELMKQQAAMKQTEPGGGNPDKNGGK